MTAKWQPQPETWNKAGLENAILDQIKMIRNEETKSEIWEEWLQDRNSHANMVVIFNQIWAEREAQWASQ